MEDKSRRNIQNYRAIKIFIVVIVMTGLLSSCSTNDDNENEDVTFQFPYRSLTEYGLCHIENNIARFTDFETGNDVALCSKPNCQHIRTYYGAKSTCDGYLGINPEFLFMAGDSIYWMASPEEAEDSLSTLFDRILYRADKNGKNRKKVYEFSNVQNVFNAAYCGDYFAFGYVVSMSNQKEDGINLDELPKRKAGVYMVNIKTSEAILVDEFEEYGILCRNVFFNSGKLYYFISYTTEDLINPYGNVTNEEYNRKHDAIAKHMIFEYDLLSGEKKIVWDGTKDFLITAGRESFLVDEGTRVILVNKGEKKVELHADDLTDHNSEYVSKYIYENDIYMADGKQVWYRDSKTGELKKVANGKLDGKGIESIIGIEGNIIYYTCKQGTEHCYYMIEKDAFLSGDIENAKIIMEAK